MKGSPNQPKRKNYDVTTTCRNDWKHSRRARRDGVGIGIGLTGLGMATAVGRNPGAFTPILVHGILAIAFTEAIVFYALYLLGH